MMFLKKLREKYTSEKEKVISKLGKYKVVLKTLPLSAAIAGMAFLAGHLAYFLIAKRPVFIYESNPYIATLELGSCAATIAGLGYYINKESKESELKRTYQEFIDQN